MGTQTITKEKAQEYFPVLEKVLNEKRELVISEGFGLMINLLKKEHNLTGNQAFKVFVLFTKYLDAKRTLELKVFDKQH